ncbi:MAG: NAD-dependent deacylase [Phycisphaerae bacterium]|nr:NAD-dependent deacylase [Phycisphaerae bacterium]NIX29181.1 NAD-dependent protein deacylase [Phycisphaerae bacterium]
MQTLETQIQAAAELIRRASHVVALTGAGISTPSGIPDFRSPKSGLWNHTNPMDVASIMAFRQRPIDFYDWVRPLARKVKEAKPNAAHYALADLEAAGKLKAIITQNIDGLHQAANSKNVLEVHGHNREMTCLNCYRVKEAEPLFERFLHDGEVPYCECGGVLKPNVILFGEQLPVQTLHQAKAAVAEADLLVVAGSSLEVAPISDLPSYALEQNTPIIIINCQDTYIDPEADLIIHHELTEVLPKIVLLALN